MGIVTLLLACSEPVAPPPAPTPDPLSSLRSATFVDTGLTALAASSLTEVLPKVASAWKARGGSEVMFSFDSSSKLARQVEAGAPADLVFFADADTMDALEQKPLLAAGTRRDVAGNALVLVVPAAATWTPAVPADLASPSLGHLALAGENVPAGRYARAALTAAGVWTRVEPKVVTGDNVRTTLAWVTRGEAEAGVVYATDAKVEPKVRTAFAFPPDSHPPVRYPAAALAASAHSDEAMAFLDFCSSAGGQEIFAEAGFLPPPSK